jgi:hypothetical protein
MIEARSATLFSGGARGSEAAFGAAAESFGLSEVNFTYAGHEPERARGLRMLTPEDLALKDVSLHYVSRLMGRTYPDEMGFRHLLQSICWQVASGREVFVVGEITADGTVKGGTGWGAEFAKICNKSLHVYDQVQLEWFRWDQSRWVAERSVAITRENFTGTGTRSINDAGRAASGELFERSFRR